MKIYIAALPFGLMEFTPSVAMEFGVEAIALTMMIVFLSGIACMLISKKTRFPYTPLLIFFGILVGPILHLILPETARMLFYYIRAFGLFLVMLAAGFQLKISLLKKHMVVIGLLDTLGLLIIALLAGWFFQVVFHVPWVIGFLFGAIVSGTDPATLVPLFKAHKIDKDTETIILTEAIFNGPLAIILTLVAFIFIIPEVPALQDIILIVPSNTLYLAATFFFLYQILASALLGLGFAALTYYMMDKLKVTEHPYAEILVLAMAFGAYVFGEFIKASGFLVVTVMAIILANYTQVFKRKSEEMSKAIDNNAKFTDTISTFAIILIFVLLGSALSVSRDTLNAIFYGTIVALFVIFVARPLATLVILPKTGVKKYLFISFEGPKGAVAASMATLPIAIGSAFGDANLVYWGEIILVSALMTVFLSMILESAWMPYLGKKLLDKK